MNRITIFKILGYSVIGFFLIGCEKEVSFTPAFSEKLVVQSFVAPQNDIIEVVVAKSIPSTGNINIKNTPVHNATVVLSNEDDATSIQLEPLEYSDSDRNNGWRRYAVESSLFPLEAGQSYTLSIQTPEGLSASGSCTIPDEQVAASDISVQITDHVNNNNQAFKRFRITWPDFIGVENYYSWSAISRLKTMDQNNDDVIAQGFVTEYLGDYDADENGLLESNLRSIALNGLNYQPERSYLEIYLAHTDKNYFDYHFDLIRQNQFESNDPNISPPVSIISNIEGGIGIFAAYNLTIKRVPLFD